MTTTTRTITPTLRWTRNGTRQVFTGPAGVIGWYQPTGRWWATFTPARRTNRGRCWAQQLAHTEPEARHLIERHTTGCTPATAEEDHHP